MKICLLDSIEDILLRCIAEINILITIFQLLCGQMQQKDEFLKKLILHEFKVSNRAFKYQSKNHGQQQKNL